jgi:phosphate transport system substrate-binding protein
MLARHLVALTLILFSLACPIRSESADPSGSLVIAGNGPEYRVIEQLTRAFEKANPRAYVDILWDLNAKPVETVKAGQAHIAVTGSPDPELLSAQIAWDGIAVLVNLSNTTKEVTSQQVADLFAGRITQWSDLGGPETRVLILDRARQTNIRETFEQRLGIAGKIPESSKVIGPDDKAVKTVAGTLPPLSAVTYVSLATALEAVASGVAVRLLPIDKVEPEEPTVKDGRYTLRRPLLLLTRKEPNPLVEAFLSFALSPAGQKILDTEYTMVNHDK